MNVLILNGSPNHEKGNTGIIIKALEKGLNKSKPTITTKHVYNLKVNPCQGCFSCWKNTPGKCVHKDDVEEILALVAESDILILATPVYVDGMTGPLKTLLDRFIPLLKGRVELRDDHMRHLIRDHVKRGKMVLVSPSGFAELDNFDPLVAHVKALSKNLGFNYVGEILVPSSWHFRYDKKGLANALEVIESAGVSLADKGMIPSDVSTKIGALVSRENVVETLNSAYSKYE